MLTLPPSNSPLRELFAVEDLIKFDPASTKPAPTFFDASATAKMSFALDTSVESIHSICVRANGNIELVKFYQAKQKRRLDPGIIAETLWVFGSVEALV